MRAALRAPLGWLAVSGEDDPPHAPTNMPCTADPMGAFDIALAGVSQRFTCRAALKLATDLPRLAGPGTRPRTLPTEARRQFDDLVRNGRGTHYDDIVLFVHGLGSVLEESDAFKRALIAQGRRHGRRYAILSVDLPGFGYSARIDTAALLRDRNGGNLGAFAMPDGRNSTFPLLGVMRDVLVRISDAIPGGTAYAVGGSLGGNLTLWLAERLSQSTLSSSTGYALSGTLRAFASWSPASIWESYERSLSLPTTVAGRHLDIVKHEIRKRTRERTGEPEHASTRKGFFELMQRGEPVAGIHVLPAWGYPPTRPGLLQQAELYGEAYRRTFWMAAYEQAVFSHQEPLIAPGAASRTWPIRTINRPLLIAAGERDDGPVNYWRNVHRVTDASPDVPGRRLLMRATGHSMSDERPQHLAAEVAAFFAAVDGRVASAGDDLWAMRLDSSGRSWSHTSPAAAHPFLADIACDDGAPGDPVPFGAKLLAAADFDGDARVGGPAVKLLAVGDFDGDGRAELIVAPVATGSAGNDLWAMRFDSRARRWQHMSPIAGRDVLSDIDCDLGAPGGPVPFGAKLLAAADFAGDRRSVLVVAPDAAGRIGR